MLPENLTTYASSEKIQLYTYLIILHFRIFLLNYINSNFLHEEYHCVQFFATIISIYKLTKVNTHFQAMLPKLQIALIQQFYQNNTFCVIRIVILIS